MNKVYVSSAARAIFVKLTTEIKTGVYTFLILVVFLGSKLPLKAQTQTGIFKHAELELNLGAHSIGFYQESPNWIGNTLKAVGTQVGLTLPIAPNTALIGQVEVQKQYKLVSEYYCDIECGYEINVRKMDGEYLIKPFVGLGLRHYFMRSGLWIQAMYLATYAPFYSGSGKNGYYRYENSMGTYRSVEYYTLTSFKSVPVFQQYLRFSLGFQWQPFKKSGLGFGVGAHSTLGKNTMDFDVVRSGNQGISHANPIRQQIPINQVAIGFSASFFLPLHAFRKSW